MRKYMTYSIILIALPLLFISCTLPKAICSNLESCFGDDICVDGQCQTAFGRNYNLIIDSAQIPEKNAQGQAWDQLDGLPDAYCEFQPGQESTQRTNVIDDTLTPEWEASFQFTLRANQDVTFTCWDQDALQQQQKLFERTVTLTAEDLRQKTLTLRNDVGFDLQLRLDTIK